MWDNNVNVTHPSHGAKLREQTFTAVLLLFHPKQPAGLHGMWMIDTAYQRSINKVATRVVTLRFKTKTDLFHDSNVVA